MKTLLQTIAIIFGLLLCIESKAQRTHAPYPGNYDLLRYEHDTLYLFKYAGNGNMVNTAKIPVVNIRKGRELTESDFDRAFYPTGYRFHYYSKAATIRTDSLFYLHYNGKVIDGSDAEILDKSIFWTVKSSLISAVGSLVLLALLILFFPKIIQTEKIAKGFLLCGILGLLAGPLLLFWDYIMPINTAIVLWVRIMWAVASFFLTLVYWRIKGSTT